MPKLSKEFLDNLMEIAAGLHGRPINVNYAEEWKISEVNSKLLLEYLYKTGIIEITWLPEQQQMCFIHTNYKVN